MAVHTLREGCSDSQRLSFLAEALTLGQFDHSHVVRLEGVVTRGRAGAPPAWVGGGVGEEMASASITPTLGLLPAPHLGHWLWLHCSFLELLTVC